MASILSRPQCVNSLMLQVMLPPCLHPPPPVQPPWWLPPQGLPPPSPWRLWSIQAILHPAKPHAFGPQSSLSYLLKYRSFMFFYGNDSFVYSHCFTCMKAAMKQYNYFQISRVTHQQLYRRDGFILFWAYFIYMYIVVLKKKWYGCLVCGRCR